VAATFRRALRVATPWEGRGDAGAALRSPSGVTLVSARSDAALCRVAAPRARAQGIPWDRMPWSREHYRKERLAAYQNFVRARSLPCGKTLCGRTGAAA
jgi:hypothetical protein